MKKWLKIIKSSVEETTYASYNKIVNGKMTTYFKNKDITLKTIKPQHIQDFYQYLIDNELSGNTVKHYHANIRKESYLLGLKEKQEQNKIICGKSYNQSYLDYICVDNIGTILNPDYITQSFRKLLKRKKMRVIRVHDLRHSCASLLLANGINMKEIQVWLGHSYYNTTAQVYAHLDTKDLNKSADVMSNVLDIKKEAVAL